MLIYLQVIETEEDKNKFEDIYQKYRGLMYYVAYKRLHHEQDTEDAVHHAFMKIAENITAIDPVSPKTKQFVVTIVNNRVTDMLRMNGRHPAAEYNDEILSGLSSELHTDDLLTEAILKLPEQQRHVIWLKYYHGYSLREISKMLVQDLLCHPSGKHPQRRLVHYIMLFFYSEKLMDFVYDRHQ